MNVARKTVQLRTQAKHGYVLTVCECAGQGSKKIR